VAGEGGLVLALENVHDDGLREKRGERREGREERGEIVYRGESKSERG
jgi:hypothetical protein